MSAIEIRTYEGDGSDLAELTNRVWRATVGGKMLFPLWSREYFRWRLLDERGGGSDFHVAAYDGPRIVGCILAEPMSFQVRGRAVDGTLSSWLTIDPGVKSTPLSLRLLAELRKRHEERGMSFSMGYTGTEARRFWAALGKRPPYDLHLLDRISFWTRPFDAGAVAASGFSFVERYGPPLAKLLPGLRPTPRSRVRPFQTSDLPRCLKWLEAQSEGADIRIVWSASRLEVQLAHPYARTLVLEDGDDGGFINYYAIEMLGASKVRVAVIDLFAGTLGFWQQLALLAAACRQMRDERIHMTVMMKGVSARGRVFAAAGFIPYRTDVDLFWFFTDLRLEPPVRYHVLFG